MLAPPHVTILTSEDMSEHNCHPGCARATQVGSQLRACNRLTPEDTVQGPGTQRLKPSPGGTSLAWRSVASFCGFGDLFGTTAD